MITPRPIDFKVSKPGGAVILADGFTPDPRERVKFSNRAAAPVRRSVQIVPIEMLSPILALTTCGDRLRDIDLLFFVDSKSVEAALVKGHSSKEDLCEFISVFWDLRSFNYRYEF